MVRVERLDPQQFLDLRAEWGGVLDACPGHGIFLTWEWLYTWWECFGDSKRLYLLAARDEDRRLLGILPLCVVRHRWLRVLQFIGRGVQGRRSAGEYSAGMDLICRPERGAEVAGAFLAYIGEHASDWDLLYLDELFESSPRTALLVAACRSRLFHAHLSPGQNTYYIDLPSDYEEFRQRLSAKMRANVGRRTRQLEKRYRSELVAVDRGERVEEMLEVYYDLIRKRHQKELPPPRRRFHLSLSRRLLEKGALRFHILFLDEQPACSFYGFQEDGRLLYYKGAMNPEFAKAGVGTVFINRLIRESIEARLREFDFLIGEDAYKSNWEPRRRPWSRLLATRFSPKGLAFIAAYRMAHRLRRWMKLLKGKSSAPAAAREAGSAPPDGEGGEDRGTG